jgi:hypothetical protein
VKFIVASGTKDPLQLRPKKVREALAVLLGLPQGLAKEYLEEELNQLMSEKVKNEKNAKNAFEERVKETKRKAIEENIKNAEKSGNSLTQTIDDNGNLISVNDLNTQEKSLSLNESISVADIRKELFEGENIVVGKSDYGQSELISGPFSKK